jgi:hypothetical protein
MMETQVKIVGTDTILVAFDRAKDPLGAFGKAGIRLVGNMAAAGRGILMDQFTDSSSGELRYNSPDRPFYSPFRRDKNGRLVRRHRQPLFSTNAGYEDHRGRKLIRYSLKGRGATKEAHLSSYPMNLWERRQDGRSKWIMTVRLAPMVAARGPKYIAEAEAMLEADMNRLIQGGR